MNIDMMSMFTPFKRDLYMNIDIKIGIMSMLT